MRISFSIAALLVFCPGYWSTVIADTATQNYELQIGFSRARLKGVTLGDDASLDQLNDDKITISFDLSYPVIDQFFVFFGGDLFKQSETVKTANSRSRESGFDPVDTGIGYVWGDDVEYQLEIGRIEYSDERRWWWDESLDTLRLQFGLEDIEFMLAAGSQQGRERSSDNFIDPEEKGIDRLLANIHWNLPGDQRLIFYFLSHEDESASYALGDSIAENLADESDADQRWLGLAYQGELEQDSVGDIAWRVGYARVSGDEIIYGFSGPTVNAVDRFDIDASAYEILLEWKPEWVDDVKFIFSHAVGSGDTNLSDSRVDSFRQSGLHSNEADYLYYGELYQPELSNIQINSLGISLETIDNLDIALLMHNYQQDELDTSMRDVAIDLDTNGLNRDLGSEIDLIAAYEVLDGLELEFIAAVFEAGDAYGANSGRKSRYWSIDLNYQF